MDNYNDSDMDLEDSDGDVVFDADLLLEATKSNVQNWILIHDDKGFTGCAKVFTYAPNNQVYSEE